MVAQPSRDTSRGDPTGEVEGGRDRDVIRFVACLGSTVAINALVFFPFGPTASLPRKFWRGRHRKNDKRTFHVGQNRLTVNPMENLSSVQNRLQSES